ncbi:hypothetical protein L227DRAFT_654679 [Lentinus tigrinus ALCF2SS1-6]|uniref:Uncharacterized protein n=1 Tax=Lentinus tigrinus ALCF2SS1-6 TaxID=1328759 RepID=A0A5C2S4T1_9APHY|nr:hypothetical protein L227DRAFT_654679 [Lentinus tigrinus ALCF2SS1-6]
MSEQSDVLHGRILPDTSEPAADIGRDITLLTVLLKDVRHGKSTVQEAKKTGLPRSDLWSDIAYAFTTGSATDQSGNKVIAVTDRTEPDHVAVTVVSQLNTSVVHSKNDRSSPIKVDEIFLVDVDNLPGAIGPLDEIS